jgi:hypothetical protein
VVTGVVVEYGDRLSQVSEIYGAVVLDVTEVLVGEKPGKQIKIRGGDGRNCITRIYPRSFPLERACVFSVVKLDNGEFQLHSCAACWLPVEDGIVSGVIEDAGTSTMTYEELVIRIVGLEYEPPQQEKGRR